MLWHKYTLIDNYLKIQVWIPMILQVLKNNVFLADMLGMNIEQPMINEML